MNPINQPKQTVCNPEKLFTELQSAGIPIESVDAHGQVTYRRPLTPPEKTLSSQLIEKHTPEASPPGLAEVLLNADITPEIRLEALWQAVIEQDNRQALTLQQTIAALKASQPHESN